MVGNEWRRHILGKAKRSTCGHLAHMAVPAKDSPRRDLNSRPLVYKTSALTPELRRQSVTATAVVAKPYTLILLTKGSRILVPRASTVCALFLFATNLEGPIEFFLPMG